MYRCSLCNALVDTNDCIGSCEMIKALEENNKKSLEMLKKLYGINDNNKNIIKEYNFEYLCK